jgi:hypothetical protein
MSVIAVSPADLAVELLAVGIELERLETVWRTEWDERLQATYLRLCQRTDELLQCLPSISTTN